MALIDCPECGGKGSDRAAACPHCGVPAKSTVPVQPQGDEAYRLMQEFLVFLRRVIADVAHNKAFRFDDKAWNDAISCLIQTGRILGGDTLDYWPLVSSFAKAASLCKAGLYQEVQSALSEVRQNYDTMAAYYKDRVAQ